MTTAGGDTRSLLERALLVGAAPAGEANADILDAAYELFCRQGIQRTTMEDVARRARVSRITVYRRVDSKEALVEQVVLREFRHYIAHFLRDVAEAGSLAERVAIGFASALRAIRGNPLIEGLMTAEPQTLAPSILGPQGSTLAVVGQFVAGQLRREQGAGYLDPAVDVDLVAELMVRISASLLLTPSPHIDLDDEEQLRLIAQRYLVPMLAVPESAGQR